MNSSKLLNMCRYILRYKPCQKITNIKNIKLSLKNTTKVLLYSTVAGIAVQNIEFENIDEIKSINHNSILTEDFLNIAIKLTDLIKTLQTAITDTCEKYRHCMEKQIDIITRGTNVGPSSTYWDKLVELRNEAENLKREFETYKDLVQHVGQASFSLALCSALINAEDADKYICNDFFDLERLSNEETAENKKMETLLLESTMKSIMQTGGALKNDDKKDTK